MVNCSVTRMCKFANDQGIDIFEVILLDIKAILHGFE